MFFDRRSCQIGRRTGPNAHQYQKDASQARLIRGLARQRLRQSRIRAILLSIAKDPSLVIIAHHPTAPFETDSVRSDRLGIEQVVAGPELAATLDQLKRPQPSQGVVEAATVRFVPGLDRHFRFAQRVGIYLGEHLQN